MEAARRIRNLRYDTGLSGHVVVLVSVNETPRDDCPHCLNPLEIVLVRFRLTRTVMIQVCPNCALASAEDSRQGSLEHLFRAHFRRRAEDRSKG